MIDLNLILACLFAYLFGSIPYALVIGKVFYKTDIRLSGSGNLGGTNAGRVLGKWAGISVSFMDVAKALVVILVVNYYLPHYAALAGVFATIGHCYPIFAQFKGGKAVSTAFGFLIGVSTVIVGKPIELFLIPTIIWFVTLKLTKYVSLSSMLSVSVAVIISLFVQSDRMISFYLLLIDLLLIYRHRSNIKRLLDHTERKVTWI